MKAIIEKDLSYLEEEEGVPSIKEINELFEILIKEENQGIILKEYFNKIKQKLSSEEKNYFQKKIEEEIVFTAKNEYVFNMKEEETHSFEEHKLYEKNTKETLKQIKK